MDFWRVLRWRLWYIHTVRAACVHISNFGLPPPLTLQPWRRYTVPQLVEQVLDGPDATLKAALHGFIIGNPTFSCPAWEATANDLEVQLLHKTASNPSLTCANTPSDHCLLLPRPHPSFRLHGVEGQPMQPAQCQPIQGVHCLVQQHPSHDWPL